jgi:hypothetical protein
LLDSGAPGWQGVGIENKIDPIVYSRKGVGVNFQNFDAADHRLS